MLVLVLVLEWVNTKQLLRSRTLADYRLLPERVRLPIGPRTSAGLKAHRQPLFRARARARGRARLGLGSVLL